MAARCHKLLRQSAKEFVKLLLSLIITTLGDLDRVGIDLYGTLLHTYMGAVGLDSGQRKVVFAETFWSSHVYPRIKVAQLYRKQPGIMPSIK